MRGSISTTGNVGLERIWGLDSDSGADWTQQPNRSLGLENRSSGGRGTDPLEVPDVRINEIDDNYGVIEIRNASGSAVDLANWFLLISRGQDQAVQYVTRFSNSLVLSGGGFVVLANDPGSLPPEIPGGVPVRYLTGANVGSIDLNDDELTCALYTSAGQVADVVRCAAKTGTVVHNNPRTPCHWTDFVGAAPRYSIGDASVARSRSADSDSGLDWQSAAVRTIGSENLGFVGLEGPRDVVDVRLNQGLGSGLGISVIVNAGTAAAGWDHGFLLSLQHSEGLGPFFGLGLDAITNYGALAGLPPFSGTLDSQGSARWDFPPGIFVPGVDADFVFYVTTPGQLKITQILEFDT